MRPLVATAAGLFILVACGGQAAPSTTEPATTTPTVAPTVATTTTVTPETTAAPSTTTAPVALKFPEFAVPFTLGEQPGWSVTDQMEDWGIELSTAPPRILLVTSEGPGPATSPSQSSIDLWVEHFNSDEFVEASEVEEGMVGGLPARVFDLRLLPSDDPGRPSACPRPCFLVLNRSIGAEGAGGFAWFLIEGSPNRAWLVDVNDVTVAFLAESVEDDFEAWVAEVEAALAGLVWTG